MSLALYMFYTIANLAILLYGLAVWRRTRRVSTLLLAAVAFGLVYDNLMLSLGNALGAGDLLYWLSVPRFVLHQIVLPWAIVAGFEQLRRAGIGWAQRPAARWGAVLVSVLVLVAGIMTRLVGMTLEPVVMDGVTRYVAVNVSGPPLVSVISIGLVGIMGIWLWRGCGWPWVFVASLLVFIAEGLPVEAVRRVFGSGFEVVWMGVLFTTELRLHQGRIRRRAGTAVSSPRSAQGDQPV